MSEWGENVVETKHELKTWPEYFTAVASGEKTFEIRKNDRNFQVGDRIKLVEYDPEKYEHTGRYMCADITYITDFEQKDDYVVFGIKIKWDGRP